MNEETVILITEDDDGHADLLQKNLVRANLGNSVIRFSDGLELLDFLFNGEKCGKRKNGSKYILLLDIQLPRMDGREVLRHIKKDGELKKIPVIMLTTTDDPREIDQCFALGCSSYITKPVGYDRFADVVGQIKHFLSVSQVPRINFEARDHTGAITYE